MKTVITFGTYDVFHVGHLNLLLRAAALGDRLVVGVSTDDLNYKKKGRLPVYSESERVRIVSALRCVDDVFLEESLEQKSEYLIQHGASMLVMGNDWKGKFDHYLHLCEVVYIDRTPSISSTELIEKIRS